MAGWRTDAVNLSFPSWSFAVGDAAPGLAAGALAFVAFATGPGTDAFAFVALADFTQGARLGRACTASINACGKS